MIDTALAPAETMTRMKPSEALRLGRLIRPRETSGAVFAHGDAACPIGAMLLAYGYDGPTDDYLDVGGGAPYVALCDFLPANLQPRDIWARNDQAPPGRGDAVVLRYLESHGW